MVYSTVYACSAEAQPRRPYVSGDEPSSRSRKDLLRDPGRSVASNFQLCREVKERTRSSKHAWGVRACVRPWRGMGAWHGRSTEHGCARRHPDVFRANGGPKKTRRRPRGSKEPRKRPGARVGGRQGIGTKRDVRISRRPPEGAARGEGEQCVRWRFGWRSDRSGE